MRTFLLALIFTFLLSATLQVAHAQESTSGATRKDRVKEKVETRKENVKERVETRKERMASKEAALKTRLQNFKDKRKATVAEKVNTNLNAISTKRVEMMSKHLGKMTEILTKLETRVSEAGASGKDTSQATSAIAEAKTAIQKAQAALGAQAQKDYTITVTSESTVKADAKGVRDSLHTDLKATHDLVIAAKQAVANAIRVAKSSLGGQK